MGLSSPNYRTTFPVLLSVVALYWALASWLAPPSSSLSSGHRVGAGDGDAWYAVAGAGDGDDAAFSSRALSWWRTALYNFLYLAFALYTWYILARIRAVVRFRHGIPARAAPVLPGCVEDACVSFWCGCCSVAQLARQTASYGDDDDDSTEGQELAAWCTPTGLREEKGAGGNGWFWERKVRGGRAGDESHPSTILTV
jgi:hypothetical protein